MLTVMWVSSWRRQQQWGAEKPRRQAAAPKHMLRRMLPVVGMLPVRPCIPSWRAGLVDEARVAIAGGSHGGLLTGHLVGQHPARFRAGALRNPVMDVSLMVHVSDIPDWCYCEAWGVAGATCTSAVLCSDERHGARSCGLMRECTVEQIRCVEPGPRISLDTLRSLQRHQCSMRTGTIG